MKKKTIFFSEMRCKGTANKSQNKPHSFALPTNYKMKKQTNPEPHYASTLPGIFVALDQLKRMASLTDKDNIIDGKHYQNYLPKLIRLYLKAHKKRKPDVVEQFMAMAHHADRNSTLTKFRLEELKEQRNDNNKSHIIKNKINIYEKAKRFRTTIF